MIVAYTLQEIESIAKAVLKESVSKVIRIDGPMGAGKTTLIKALCAQLGVVEAVNSPTFSLVNAYKVSKEMIYHFDFYRLNHAGEALDFGLEEYLESGNFCFLEWADKVAEHLPLHYDYYKISIRDDSKRIIQKLTP